MIDQNNLIKPLLINQTKLLKLYFDNQSQTTKAHILYIIYDQIYNINIILFFKFFIIQKI